MRQGVFAKDVLLLENEIEKLLKMIPILKQLPVQLVHSDIVAGNVLAKGDEVSAILDFEFVTPDLRAMDAAVFINELVKYHGDRWELLDAFIAGYSASAKLTADEIEALPQLILLRSIVLCIHFLGRQWAGVDLHDANEPYLNSFRKVYDWLDHNQNQLRELCYRRFEQEVKG
jgi:homoserine kinase type II